MPHRVPEILSGDSKTKCKELAKLGLSDQDVAFAESCGLGEAPPVIDDEELGRVFEDPVALKLDTYDAEASVGCNPAAFADAYNKGLSVQRLRLTTLAAIDEFGRARSAEKGRRYLGVVTCRAGALRNARREPELPRLLSVFATPLPESASHADVCVHVPVTSLDKEYLKLFFWEVFNGKEFAARLIQSKA